jgi:hypothetical protein
MVMNDEHIPPIEDDLTEHKDCPIHQDNSHYHVKCGMPGCNNVVYTSKTTQCMPMLQTIMSKKFGKHKSEIRLQFFFCCCVLFAFRGSSCSLCGLKLAFALNCTVMYLLIKSVESFSFNKLDVNTTL